MPIFPNVCQIPFLKFFFLRYCVLKPNGFKSDKKMKKQDLLAIYMLNLKKLHRNPKLILDTNIRRSKNYMEQHREYPETMNAFEC